MTDSDFATGWLVREDDVVLSTLLVPVSAKLKLKGLIGLDSIDAAYYFAGAQAIHTVGMRFDLDVAVLSKDHTVAKLVRMKPNRFLWAGPRSGGVIEAESGSFNTWGLQIGDKLELRF